LGVGGEHCGHRLLKLPPCLDTVLNLFDPFRGDALDTLLPPYHEGERPHGVSLLFAGTVASGLTTTAVGERKRTGQQVSGDGKAAEKLELALAKPGGLRTFGGDLHMSVIIHTEYDPSSLFSGMRK
jgi:hypothetical protein